MTPDPNARRRKFLDLAIIALIAGIILFVLFVAVMSSPPYPYNVVPH